MDFNPYTILELSRTATDEEIRNAYKRLALKYHPDKPTGNEDKFKQVSRAYQILTDPFKKKVYDTQFDDNKMNTINDFITNFTSSFMTVLHDNLQEKLANKQASKKPNVVSLKLDVDIQDIYNALVKKMVVKIKDEMDYVKRTVYISLVDYHDTFLFEGKGDKVNGVLGDLEVKLSIASNVVPEVSIDEITRHDLVMGLDISIHEYYYGVTRRIPYFNGELLEINHVPWQLDIERYGSYRYVVKGKGLPYLCDEEQRRGNLNIYFGVKFEQVDESLLAENEALVKTLFQSKHDEYIF